MICDPLNVHMQSNPITLTLIALLVWFQGFLKFLTEIRRKSHNYHRSLLTIQNGTTTILFLQSATMFTSTADY